MMHNEIDKYLTLIRYRSNSDLFVFIHQAVAIFDIDTEYSWQFIYKAFYWKSDTQTLI